MRPFRLPGDGFLRPSLRGLKLYRNVYTSRRAFSVFLRSPPRIAYFTESFDFYVIALYNWKLCIVIV